MKKPLLQSVFVLLLALAAGSAFAQIAPKAYAPENLRTLSVQDQTRVISLEYSEQSRGRRIPDDQLRFYLDQVNRSNWTFSRIKQDIAQSLGGNNGGWNPNPPPTGGQVTCESKDNRRRECQTGFRRNAVLVQNLSGTRCVEGQNWGSGNGIVWVDRGCRGRFAEGTSGGGWGGGNGGGWGNRASITVYRDSNYRGASQTFEGEVRDLSRSGMNDQISSMRFRGTWEACTDAYFRGNCRTFTGDVANLQQYGMNDRISSLRPVRGYGRDDDYGRDRRW